METFAFIDGSNLSYGGEKSLGWSIDYAKLLRYLKEKYAIERIYFFGGIEIRRFPFDRLIQETVPIQELIRYFEEFLQVHASAMDQKERLECTI